LGSTPRLAFSCFETVTTEERINPVEQRAPGVRSVQVRVNDPRCADVPAVAPCREPRRPVNSPVQAAPGFRSGPGDRGDCGAAPPPSEAPPALARLVFHVLDDRVVIFAVTPSGDVRTYTASLTRSELERRIAELRDALDVDAAGRGIRM